MTRTITVIASYARDTLRSEDTVEVRRGGPAYFIARALTRRGARFKMHTGSTIDVDIEVRDGRERSIVRTGARIPNTAAREPVLVSTILREFDLSSLACRYAVDVQGYVRDGEKLGGKQRFTDAALRRAWLVKATREELAYVEPACLARDAILLVTDGARGFEVRGSERFRVATKPIERDDTVGAGDTLFAVFALELLRGATLREAAERAQAETERFLKRASEEVLR